MELQLKNIGMIKEANVFIDGLTVIAGENDTGKSTVGKALYVILKSREKGFTQKTRDENIRGDSAVLNVGYLMSKLFKQNSLSEGGYLSLKTEYGRYSLKRDDRFSAPSIGEEHIGGVSEKERDIIFIETPLVWNFMKLFSDLSLIESQMNISLDYPYFFKDLHFKLSIKRTSSKSSRVTDDTISLMEGRFIQDDKGNFFFHKNGQDIEMINTATGIKYFGIFQVLSQNNYLNENTVLVLDEPEVHLHPKWQLEMAKIIVELVKNGVKILVNSHSPYMIEALQRYSELEKVNADFYLAEDGYIKKENNGNSETLVKIFEKLSEPFDVFEEMESERFQNG
ncbi:MAG: ABC transporter, ATP-binding protein [uncultured Sulfurovum sp.]|uniref:ABC transporter, ATP-binding protein n=1 Tax=uncultured Sulfurovum sp. TaxID=269237 RepID=A0A6S6SK75_9BACT|nr:MAG: ABC transporter, ATP-binding protein [uncultured Sulfurovum sp.]